MLGIIILLQNVATPEEVHHTMVPRIQPSVVKYARDGPHKFHINMSSLQWHCSQTIACNTPPTVVVILVASGRMVCGVSPQTLKQSGNIVMSPDVVSMPTYTINIFSTWITSWLDIISREDNELVTIGVLWRSYKRKMVSVIRWTEYRFSSVKVVS